MSTAIVLFFQAVVLHAYAAAPMPADHSIHAQSTMDLVVSTAVNKLFDPAIASVPRAPLPLHLSAPSTEMRAAQRRPYIQPFRLPMDTAPQLVPVKYEIKGDTRGSNNDEGRKTASWGVPTEITNKKSKEKSGTKQQSTYGEISLPEPPKATCLDYKTGLPCAPELLTPALPSSIGMLTMVMMGTVSLGILHYRRVTSAAYKEPLLDITL
eukprot:gnl/MRDRNA2_/MRDRNA2_165600_c0_seq1.p1 gnl/MRDRNA2_/MRDRNA2_165600_c0~~gnl/MRDRNA2_/MRDRNA2_165600_c0_seq1.p1  ORF type:complete len:237 (+),score=33.05 gnl/MRDRNA2_/MRDRNA2_165600_c0_seq1:84-713(+)